jgi:hypothetical protein
MGQSSGIADVVRNFRSIETEIKTMKDEINSNWQHTPGLGDVERLIEGTFEVQVKLGRLLVAIGEVAGGVSA